MRFEQEPIDENKYICALCGLGTNALWEVILRDDEQLFVCDKDHKDLQYAGLIFFERRIGDMHWEDNIGLKKFLNEYERERNPD